MFLYNTTNANLLRNPRLDNGQAVMSRFVSVVDTSCIKLKSISGTYI